MTPEEHARAVVDKMGFDKKTYGPLIHHIDCALRYEYLPYGFYDNLIRWLNRKRNKNMRLAEAKHT